MYKTVRSIFSDNFTLESSLDRQFWSDSQLGEWKFIYKGVNSLTLTCRSLYIYIRKCTLQKMNINLMELEFSLKVDRSLGSVFVNLLNFSLKLTVLTSLQI